MSLIRNITPLPISTLPQAPKFHTNLFLLLPRTNKFQISCSKSNKNNSSKISDADLATEIENKINGLCLERENAMNKSKQLLFTELCQYLNLKPEQLKNKWRKMMNEDEKLCLVKVFVSDWAVDFHPLSPTSVKEMVDEYLASAGEDSTSNPVHSAVTFPQGFKRFTGLSPVQTSPN
ncbi:hypothetical protein Ancab_017547 [Ancistrocladus abbreviatus]